MTASRPLTQQEAQDFSKRLQQNSASWRWLIIGGLLCIIGGFVVLTLTIERRREAAEEKVRVQANQIVQTDQVLESAQQIVQRNASSGQAGADWRALDRLLNVARNRNTSLGQTINVQPSVENAEAAKAVTSKSPTVAPADAQGGPTGIATPAPAGPSIIRLYIQIASEDQRPEAQAVAAAWSGQQINGVSVVVPGIQLVPGADNTLRCTRADTCAAVDPVLNWVNASLVSPRLTKRDLSKRYANATKILPGTYEIWFAPGRIALAH